jgi:type IV pilus assembly protein PilC
VFGPLFHKLALARFSRNLGTLLHSGVPLVTSLEITADTVNNVHIARACHEVRLAVREGEPVAATLAAHAVIPGMVTQMVGVGEETGTMDQLLEKIADFYDEEVERTTEALTSLLEPIMIALLGGIIGTMVVALYMPMFQIFELIG